MASEDAVGGRQHVGMNCVLSCSGLVACGGWVGFVPIDSICFSTGLKMLSFISLFTGGLAEQVQEIFLKMTRLKRHYSGEPVVYVSLKLYCKGKRVIDRYNLPGAQRMPAILKKSNQFQAAGQRKGKYPELKTLAEPAQAIIRRILEIMDDLFRSGCCLTKVDLDTFIVDKVTGCPKLSKGAQISEIPITSASQVDANVAEVAEVIEDCLFRSNNKSIYDVQEVGEGLLKLMRSQGNRMWYAILNHSSLIPLESRADAYEQMYDTLIYVAKLSNEQDYIDVLKNLQFPMNWQDQVEKNRWLLSFYCGSVYNSVDLTQVAQAKELTRYLRNGSAHGVERGMGRLSRSDIAKLQMALAPMIMHSLMTGLETVGWLVCNKLHKYMVYRF